VRHLYLVERPWVAVMTSVFGVALVAGALFFGVVPPLWLFPLLFLALVGLWLARIIFHKVLCWRIDQQRPNAPTVDEDTSERPEARSCSCSCADDESEAGTPLS